MYWNNTFFFSPNFQIDRESLTLPIASSQWYTHSLTPISSTPTDSSSTVSNSIASAINSPVVELTEEVDILLYLKIKRNKTNKNHLFHHLIKVNAKTSITFRS